MFNFSSLAMGEYQLAVERLASDLDRDPTIERARSNHTLLGRLGAGRLATQLDTMHNSVLEFWELSRHPLLKRNQLELEQDVWIRWIEALPNDPDERAAALDEDVIEDHLASIGVLGDASACATTSTRSPASDRPRRSTRSTAGSPPWLGATR